MLTGLAFGLVFPLVAVIAVTMIRMEGRTPILTFVQLATGAATGVLLLLIPTMLMAVCGFRPDRNPELTVTLNDISWLLSITPIAPFTIQNIAIGTAILNDRRHILPRWAGYLNFLIAFSFAPDVLPYFLHSGPFAWRGIFVFWLALTTYCVYLVAMGLLCRRAILNNAGSEREGLVAAAPWRRTRIPSMTVKTRFPNSSAALRNTTISALHDARRRPASATFPVRWGSGYSPGGMARSSDRRLRSGVRDAQGR